MQTRNRQALRISYAAFSAEILTLYFKTLGTLIDTSLFFALDRPLRHRARRRLGYRLMKQPATTLTEGARS